MSRGKRSDILALLATDRSTRLVRGGGINLVGLVSAQALQVAFLLLLTNALGPDLSGRYVLAIVVTGFCVMVSLFGMSWAVIRETTGEGEPEHDAAVQTTAVTVVLGISAVAVTAVLLSADEIADIFDAPRLAPLLRTLAPAIPALALLRLLNGASQAQKRMLPTVLTERMLLPGVLLASFFSVALVNRSSVIWAVRCYVAAAVISFAVAVWLARPHLSVRFGRLGHLHRGTLVFAAPLALMNIVQFSTQQLEPVLLGVLESSGDVGVYYFAARITAFGSVLLLAANGIFAPNISQLDAAGETDALRRLFRQVSQSVYSLSAILLGGIFLWSGAAARLAGEGFGDAAMLIRILLIGQFASIMVGPSGLTLTMTGRSRLNLINSLVLLTLQVVLAIVLIPRFGLTGAAVGAVVALAGVNALRVIELRYTLGIHPFSMGHFRTVASSIVALGVGLIVKSLTGGDQSFIAAVLGSAAFVGAHALLIWRLAMNADDQAAFLGLLSRGRQLVS